MKIKSVTLNEDGMDLAKAEQLWDDLEGFSSYSFNKSHSVAYSLISYQMGWLKAHYPAEFFAGLLTFSKQFKRDSILRDMKRMGIELLPPDINNSTNAFEVLHRNAVLAPFNALKGISASTSMAILDARAAGGKFLDEKDLVKRVEARRCNVRHRNILERVGAFARITPGSVPANHPDRRRDQMELMEGLVMDHVEIDREIHLDPPVYNAVIDHVAEFRACTKCELGGLCHPKPFVRKDKPVMMIVVDGPNGREEGADEIGAGRDALAEALGNAGISMNDVLITSLIKSPKPDAAPGRDRAWSNRTLAECPAWFKRELDILKPPLLLVLGTAAARLWIDDLKGGLNEHAGRVIYDRARDMNVVIGINPGVIYFHPEKQEVLNDVLEKAVSVLGL